MSALASLIAVIASVVMAPIVLADNDPTLPYLLAVSWQPGFCETVPSVPECRSQTPARWDATHFTLHGLWPQPRGKIYCVTDIGLIERDSSRRTWSRLPPLDLSAHLRRDLERMMPGAASYLDRHTWIKHGTCYGASAERYFQDSLRLLTELNASPIRDLFEARIGRRIDADTVRMAFDRHFGNGTGDRVVLRCRQERADGNDRRRVVVELWLALGGPIEPGANLTDLMRAGARRRPGCRDAVVDAAGLD